MGRNMKLATVGKFLGIGFLFRCAVGSIFVASFPVGAGRAFGGKVLLRALLFRKFVLNT